MGAEGTRWESTEQYLEDLCAAVRGIRACEAPSVRLWRVSNRNVGVFPDVEPFPLGYRYIGMF